MSKKYVPKDFLKGLVLDMWEKLMGDDGEMWARALARCLAKQNPWPEPSDMSVQPTPTPLVSVLSDLKPFRSVDLGTGLVTLADFERALEQKNCKRSDGAYDILGKPAFSVSKEPLTLDLVRVTNRELGFSKGATFVQTCAAATKLGLQLCPAEVGPQLRLQYLDQPKGEWLLIAMEPISGSGGYRSVFRVKHDDGGLWLNAHYGNPGRVWRADSTWVFVRSK